MCSPSVNAPDYENAADADMDNVYMVTVMADDGTYMAMRDVVGDGHGRGRGGH